MYQRKLLLSLSLLCFIAGGRSETKMAFSIPGVLQSDDMARGCLEVKNHKEPVDVNIVLEVNGENHTIINEQVPVNKSLMCPEFMVPTILTSSPVFITITALSQDLNYVSRRPVVITPKANITFIQLEKYMYKGGDTVHFNVFTLQNNLTPMEETYFIYVTDPAGNRLYQWENQMTKNGFLPLEFSLLDDQGYGLYTISVEGRSSRKVTKELMVSEYVLPKYSMTIDAPNSITILDKKISYNATATYTYGKGVPGKVTARICRPPSYYNPQNACNRSPDGLCFSSSGEMDSNGKFSGELDLALYQLDRPGYQMTLILQVTLTEEGTGVQTTESKTISVTSQLGRVYFSNSMNEYFKRGMNYKVKITVEDGLGQPSSDQGVEIQMEGKPVLNLTTGPDGTAQGELDTSELAQSVANIQAVYKNAEQCYDSNWIVPTYSNDYRQITRFYSRTDSFIQISGPTEELQCGQKYDLKVQYLFGKEGLMEGETTATFIHMVTSHAKIIEYGEHPIDVSTSLKGEFTVSLEVTSAHAPVADVIVYHLSKSEVITDVIHLNIENCFKNKVSLTFSEKSGTPGSNVTLDITAANESVCGVNVIDASVLLLPQGQRLNAQTVYSSRPLNNLRGYYFDGYSIEPAQPPCINSNPIKVDGLYYTPVSYPVEGDAYRVFSDAGMTFGGSNVSIFKPEVCGQSFSGRPLFMTTSLMMERPSFTTSAIARDNAVEVGAEINSVRSYFPESLYFNIAKVGENGSTSVPLKVPDTITEWKGDMICLSKEAGIGMTKYPANFTSFQLFFTEVSIPSSFVRKEILLVRAFVSNYMDKCAKVRATLSPSPDYTAEPVGDHNETCICSGQRASYSWKLNALSLGVLNISLTGETIQIGDSCEGPADPNQPSRKDTVIRTVIVEAEGVQKVETKSDYVCVNGTDKVISASVSLPENTVPDTLKAKVIVIGDIMGRALINPESLIREPTGCGEQTISVLMNLPLALQYLNLTGRLTEETKSQAVQYMAIGYRRMLSFINPDGCFNAFGSDRSGGSSWLTVMAVEVLQSIKLYTFVEERVLTRALLCLEKLQDVSTGGFKPIGNVFNSALRGGPDNDVGFTAKVATVLLQNNNPFSMTLLRGALNYLDAASTKPLSIYNMALMFCAYQEAGNFEKSTAMFQLLRDLAVDEGDTVHWDRPTMPKKQTSYIFSAPPSSAEVETASYVLLCMTKFPSPSQEYMNYMSRIALWLTKGQTSDGSYRTTSDTAVALKATSAFGLLTYQKDANNSVQLKYGDDVVRDFNLYADNRILLQTEPLSHVPGNYGITVSGNGCVLVQTAVAFNIPVSQEEAAFSLAVETSPNSCDNGVAYEIPVNLNVSYHGIKNQSNMALIDFPLPSGYNVKQQSLEQLRGKVPKVEMKNNHLIMYLNYVNETMSAYSVTLEMSTMVSNFQPRTVTVRDYYEAEENGAAVFYHPCSKI